MKADRTSKTVLDYYHSLLISVINFVSKVNDDTEILFTLYDGEKNEAITENYVVKWSRNEMVPQVNDQFSNLRVVFTDLSGQDLDKTKIYLVAYVIRLGGMEETSERRTSTLTFKRQSTASSTSSDSKDYLRRPYGVAYIDLTPIIRKVEDNSNDQEYRMPFML